MDLVAFAFDDYHERPTKRQKVFHLKSQYDSLEEMAKQGALVLFLNSKHDKKDKARVAIQCDFKAYIEHGELDYHAKKYLVYYAILYDKIHYAEEITRTSNVYWYYNGVKAMWDIKGKHKKWIDIAANVPHNNNDISKFKSWIQVTDYENLHYTVSDYNNQKQVLLGACKSGKIDIIYKLMPNRRDLSEEQCHYLEYLYKGGHVHLIQKVIDDMKLRVCDFDLACILGNVAKVQALVSEEDWENPYDYEYGLQTSIGLGHLSVLSFLLQYMESNGILQDLLADSDTLFMQVDKKNLLGIVQALTPFIIKTNTEEKRFTELMELAVSRDNVPVFEFLKNKAKYCYNTLFDLACEVGNLDMVKYALSMGADCISCGIVSAADKGHWHVFKYLSNSPLMTKKVSGKILHAIRSNRQDFFD
jgi:hypothetical protein